jgi:hypothetical protein
MQQQQHQPLQAASTNVQLPQLRRPSAYMVCPSRQAALLPKPASPVAPHAAFLVVSLQSAASCHPLPGSGIPATSSPSAPTALSCQRRSLSRCPLSLPFPSYNHTLPSCLFRDPALACTLSHANHRLQPRIPARCFFALFPAHIIQTSFHSLRLAIHLVHVQLC